MSQIEEIVAVLASPGEYAYHINQVSSVGTHNIRVVRKKLSLKTPYILEHIPVGDCTRVAYQSALSPFRIVAGLALTTLMLGIFYFLGMYWTSLEPGTTIRIGLLFLALVYGLKWAFLSRHHRIDFYLKDGSRLVWRSRPGDFKLRQRGASNVVEYFMALDEQSNEPRTV